MNAPRLADNGWKLPVKALHWLLVLAIMVVVPAGLLMSYTYVPSFHDAQVLKLHILLSQIHHTLGLLTLLCACAWIVIRLCAGRPPSAADTPAWQHVLSVAVHVLILALLIAIPWSGWTALSALADSQAYGVTHIWFFGSDQVLPRIWTPLAAEDPAGYSRFASLHRLLLYLGSALLALHIIAALWHHLIRRDDVLRKMWPLT